MTRETGTLEAAADRIKLRAVRVEAVVRAGAVAMVVASTALGFWLHR